jgi:phosphatidylinositol dimannoside acyltransferase
VELSVGGLRVASVLARHVPVPVSSLVARGLSLAAARLSPEQRLMAERNLRRVHGDGVSDAVLSRDVQRVFDSYARYWVDSLRLPGLSLDRVDRGFTVSGIEHIEAARDRGIGPILALPHLGGWEWAARYMIGVRRWPLAAVVEELEPPELYEWFLEFRRDLGMHVIPLGAAAGTESAAAVRAGEIMCLLCDRDISGTGIEVEFFGERTRLPGGPALMALRTGAPLLPTAVYFEDDRCHGVILPPLDTERRGKLRADVERVTQDLAGALEELVSRAPEQWHLLQPNWPSDYRALGRPVPDGAPSSTA